MVVRLILGFLGAFHLANGLAMLVAPDAWAAAVVHLTTPDHLHHHFMTDIGFAFAASGVGLLLGARRGAANAPWAVAGAVWPLLHGLFHLWEWLADGPPPTLGATVGEGLGVIAAGLAGAALAGMRYRKGDV
ncbi:MAG: hypothetical protein WDN08_18055 [Rhizomicrobium sp.]